MQYVCGFMPVFATQVIYSLEKSDHALTFQVLDQSSDITAFLKNRNFLSRKTGLRIGLSKYPEFKHSENFIFLRGSDKSNDFKLDVTRFVGNMQRDKAYEMVKVAIQELVDTVKALSTPYQLSGGFSFYTAPAKRVSNCGNNGKVIFIG